MTLRLVGLMSVVLLLSLAAFGLLANHYQEQLMEEVQATASDVGQATLRTLEWTVGDRVRLSGPGEVTLRPSDPDDLHDVPELHGRIKLVQHVITTSTEDQQFTVREQLVYPSDSFPSKLPGEEFEKEFEACLQRRVNAFATDANRVFINVEDVRAETDSLGGLVLKIPKLTQTGSEETGVHGEIRYELHGTDDPGVDVFFAKRDEIQLPIRGKYQELFNNLRNRSLLLFLGVFMVGMVLSVGVASRFTRPIRKLDAGIRRLSEGDLGVKVDVSEKGEIGRLAHTFNDMARKLRANRERERDMVRREKLSALGRLAAGVAHDVRNPLHSIGLTLQNLEETARPETEERSHEFDRSVGVIRGEIRRLDQLVGNFLRFAKSERHERRPIDLVELVQDTMRLVQSESDRRQVRIELRVDEPLPAVPADGEAIQSAILNLILNSFEAMPEGGSLTIALRAEAEEIVLEVADTGQGIPEDEQEHVFDFAYTTRESGHGLGLAMVHHCVVEEHGGRVALESSPAAGTRVSMVLPIRRTEGS
jgi:signal transduction histidine kinase